jgi:hypothetical protein
VTALFLLGVFPLTVAAAVCLAPENRASRIQAITLGLGAGIIVCLCRWLFVFPLPEIPADFVKVFLPLFFSVSLLPVVFLFALAYLLFSGDPGEKSLSGFLLLSSYYAVMVPYRILSAPVPAAYFESLLAPLMYALMTADAAFLFLFALRSRTPLAVIPALIAALALPPAAEALRYTGEQAYAPVTGVFLGLSLVFGAACLSKSRSKKAPSP